MRCASMQLYTVHIIGNALWRELVLLRLESWVESREHDTPVFGLSELVTRFGFCLGYSDFC